MTSPVLRVGAVLAVFGTVALGVSPAWADPVAPASGSTESTLTRADVAAQVAVADRLRQRLADSDAALAAATARLATVGEQAAAALEQVRAAQEQEAAARAELTLQVHRLKTLQGQEAQSRVDLGIWAREAYTTGGPMASYEDWITVLESQGTDDVGHDLAVLRHVGVVGGITLDRIEVVTAAQKDAASRAASAAREAVAAAARAKAAKAAADALLARQRRALAALQAEQERTIGSAQVTRQRLMRSRSAAALVAEAQLAAVVQARRSGRPAPLDPSDCRGLDVSGYGNGQIPAAALCPLWGAPQQLLRADAAAAFRDLSREFALAFGRPICVTDSYRTRSAQVAVFAAKPDLAAVPGTSNHGWGTALDLCGGVQSFGTTEHAWMLAHAPLHSWFHPGWAEPGGSRPEPWHWEFAG